MEIIGIVGILIMGVVIGLLGSGGSIITLPVLVYAFGMPPLLATTYSLIIVGVTSSFGAISYIIKKEYDIKIALLFAIPSLVIIFLTRSYLMPMVPETINWGTHVNISKSNLIMLLFGIFMVAAFYSMITSNVHNYKQTDTDKHLGFIPFEGGLVGFITGITGAGGGFLIIPSLVIANKTPIKTAVGTSLLIISINSIIGFVSDINSIHIDWIKIISYSIFSIIGVTIGSRFNHLISPVKLKSLFSWFILLMGIAIIYKEVITHQSIH
ncbi:sulfite exporter TauE/SafE family protein [Cytophaga aurantiaca]|uniref:sulfite exporter TauE/SafE family protein n=1 Tax=Cytophaga aurantiaca TaxID=29530 RepID=UPI00037218D2|nr:sulfite exporter TauE/SafE family protein [Cytophaga aurantiaca]